MSDPMCDKCADRGCAKCEPEITLARLAEREERTADTVVSLTIRQAASLLDPPSDDQGEIDAAESHIARLVSDARDALNAHTAHAMDLIMGPPFGGDAA